MQMFLNYQRLSREEKLRELEQKTKLEAYPTVNEVMFCNPIILSLTIPPPPRRVSAEALLD